MTANPQGPVRVVPDAVLMAEIVADHRRLASWNAGRDKPKRVAFHHDAASFIERIFAASQAAPSPAAPEGVEGWRELREHSKEDHTMGCTERCAPSWQSMVSAPRTIGLDFEARCGDYAPVDAYWNGSIHVHHDPDDGEIAYPFSHWRPLPASPVPLADGGR